MVGTIDFKISSKLLEDSSTMFPVKCSSVLKANKLLNGAEIKLAMMVNKLTEIKIAAMTNNGHKSHSSQANQLGKWLNHSVIISSNFAAPYQIKKANSNVLINKGMRTKGLSLGSRIKDKPRSIYFGPVANEFDIMFT